VAEPYAGRDFDLTGSAFPSLVERPDDDPIPIPGLPAQFAWEPIAVAAATFLLAAAPPAFAQSTLLPTACSPIGFGPHAVETVDVDNDGDPDVNDGIEGLPESRSYTINP
jgi:hypothetical protein